MTMEDYPYNETCSSKGCCTDPPVPNNPCVYDKARVVAKTADEAFSNATAVPAGDEAQLAAFVHHNGPTNAGIASHVFGLRAKGCEATGDCFITKEMCDQVKGMSIDHSITIVGYGTDPVHGDYWNIKNSWSTKFANSGFIKLARGVKCAHIDCCGYTFTYGEPSSYYEQD